MKVRVDTCRAAARDRIEQHTEPVDIFVRGISAQRILSDNPRRYLHIDMRPGFERRQGAAVRVDQIENDDAGHLLFPTRDQEIEREPGLCTNPFGRRDRLREYS
jgi:hypothetical protein